MENVHKTRMECERERELLNGIGMKSIMHYIQLAGCASLSDSIHTDNHKNYANYVFFASN